MTGFRKSTLEKKLEELQDEMEAITEDMMSVQVNIHSLNQEWAQKVQNGLEQDINIKEKERAHLKNMDDVPDEVKESMEEELKEELADLKAEKDEVKKDIQKRLKVEEDDKARLKEEMDELLSKRNLYQRLLEVAD